MDQMNKNGLDLTQENIQRLKKIFPECVKDGKIDFDILKALLGSNIDNHTEKYSFSWYGKNDSIKNSISPSSCTLIPDKSRSKKWDETSNIYVEGDNLEVLKVLLKTYHNGIKFIYIDPPYNTGKDFVYHDNFHSTTDEYLNTSSQQFRVNPETAGKYHTDWLNMMYPRLKIARELLKEDGVIFISIDDNEVTNLRKICDEIFDEGNFIATLKWKKKKQPSFLSTVADVMEYVIVYAKDYSQVKKLCVESLTDSDKPIINASNKDVERHFEAGIRVKAETNFIKKGEYVNKSMSITFLDDVIVEDGRTKNAFNAIGRFRNEQSLITKYCQDDLIFITKNIGFRRDLSDEEKGSGKTITDLLLDWGQNQDGSDHLKKLFNITNSDGIFDNPKPTLLIKNLMKTVCEDDDIVLDFFSGSGTSAESSFELYRDFGINVKFIMIQLPEICSEDSTAYKMGYKTICEVGEERIRRAGDNVYSELQSYKQNAGLLSEDAINPDKLDFGFKVFKLDSSNIKPWDPTAKYDETNIMDLMSIIKEDRNNLDVAYEVMLKYGVFNMPLEEIEVNGKTVYSVGCNYMIISLNDSITSDDVLAIAKLGPKAVVFKEKGFKDDNEKINADYTFKRLGIDNVKCI